MHFGGMTQICLLLRCFEDIISLKKVEICINLSFAFWLDLNYIEDTILILRFNLLSCRAENFTCN